MADQHGGSFPTEMGGMQAQSLKKILNNTINTIEDNKTQIFEIYETARSEVESSRKRVKAPAPFTTSTLQQEASRLLGFSPSKTMRVAQTLYEGIKLSEGTVGLITYLRTDSTRIAAEADSAARDYIRGQYGKEYLGGALRAKGGEHIQDAHEAIRPTAIERTPVKVKEELGRDEFRLYQLIWKRFVASRMSAAKYETTSVKISAGEHLFTLAASKVVFDGFMSVYVQEDDREAENKLTNTLTKDSELKFESFDAAQHFTQPPAHYTEATLDRKSVV